MPEGEQLASRSDDGEGFPSEDDEKCIMRSEREKITGKVAAATLRLNANRHELLPDEDCAVFLEKADADTIRAGLNTMLADPAAASARAAKAHDTLCAQFTWDAVFAALMEAVKSAKRS